MQDMDNDESQNFETQVYRGFRWGEAENPFIVERKFGMPHVSSQPDALNGDDCRGNVVVQSKFDVVRRDTRER